MTFVEALRAVRPLIESRKHFYICDAFSGTCTASDARRFKGRIMRQLAPYASYQHWVCMNHPHIFYKMNRTFGNFRDGRLQWIDDMIAKEEAK